MTNEAHDCTEGCDGSHKHKWEIEPHPDTSDFDVFVTDGDINPGEERVIRLRMNGT